MKTFGICGLLGSQAISEESAQRIHKWRESFGTQGGTAEAATGMACAASDDLLKRDEIIVAVDGYPALQDPQLSAVADRSGVAAGILEGYRRYGIKLLDKVTGEFALAILDCGAGVAILAVDRLGTHPMAYSFANDSLVFGSRADVVAELSAKDHSLSAQSIFNYLYFHVIPSPDTAFTGIRKLEPAHYLHMQAGTVTEACYWQPQYASNAGSKAEREVALKSVLSTAVARSVDPAHACGTFLSGGLDSSTVTGLAASVSQDCPAFAIGFSAEGYDEMSFARASAKHFGVTLNEHYVTPQEVVDAIPLMAEGFDEPFGNASAVPTYYCAKMAKSHGVSRLLAGDGGDEIFAGNDRYATQLLFEHYAKVPGIGRALLERLAPSLSRMSVTPIRKVGRYVEQAVIPLPDRLETYNLLTQAPLAETLSPDFLAAIDADAPLAQRRETYHRPATSSTLNRMLYLDLKFTLADNDLRKVGRASALAGMDVSYPLLDAEVVEFAAKLPPEWLIRRGELRSFYRNALADFLAPETLSKSKHGFGLPFGLWLKEYKPLQEIAQDSLRSLRDRGLLQPAYVDRLTAAHKEQHAAYYGVMIWILMMLEQWLTAHGNPSVG